jgi:dsDNA-binding SOS-regulon protein
MCFLDLKKAYDMVPHERLISKLRRAGLGNKMIKFKNFIEKLKEDVAIVECVGNSDCDDCECSMEDDDEDFDLEEETLHIVKDGDDEKIFVTKSSADAYVKTTKGAKYAGTKIGKAKVSKGLDEALANLKKYAVEYKNVYTNVHKMATIRATSVEDAREKAKTVLGIGKASETTVVGVHLWEEFIDIFEENGQEYLNLLGLEGTWIQTSYNANFRARYAAIGDRYDSETDTFKPSQPGPEYVWDESLWSWVLQES